MSEDPLLISNWHGLKINKIREKITIFARLIDYFTSVSQRNDKTNKFDIIYCIGYEKMLFSHNFWISAFSASQCQFDISSRTSMSTWYKEWVLWFFATHFEISLSLDRRVKKRWKKYQIGNFFCSIFVLGLEKIS